MTFTFIAFGRVTQFILGLVTVRVATTLLSPEEMGRVSLLLTTTAFFALFLVNPAGMFINRRLHAWQNSGTAKIYLAYYVGYLLLVSLGAAVTLLLIDASGAVNFGVPLIWFVSLVSCSLIFSTINQTSIPSLNLLGDSRSFVVYSVLTVAASLVCAWMMVEEFQPSAQFWVAGILVGQALLAVWGTRALFSHLDRVACQIEVPVRINRKQMKVFFRFIWPVGIAAGLGWVQAQGYRFILDANLGLAELGLFVAGYGISAGLIAGFESILTTYFQPRLYRDIHSVDPLRYGEVWRRYVSAVIPTLLLTVALIVLLSTELTRLLLGPQFQPAAKYVLWGALTEAARVIAGGYSLIAHVFMRTSWLMLPNLIGALLAIGLCALLIPDFGSDGAGMGLSMSGWVVVMMLHLLLGRRVGGGVPIRLVAEAALAASALGVITFVVRLLLDTMGWLYLVVNLILVGAAYFFLLYLLLRKHLMDAVSA